MTSEEHGRDATPAAAATADTTYTWDELRLEVLRQDVLALVAQPRPVIAKARLEHELALSKARNELRKEIVVQELRRSEAAPRPEADHERVEHDLVIYRMRNKLRALQGFPGFENFPDTRLSLWHQIAALRAFDMASSKEVKQLRSENNWGHEEIEHDPERWAENEKSIAEREIETAYMLAVKAYKMQKRLDRRILRAMPTSLTEHVYGTPIQYRILATLGRPYLKFRIFWWKRRVMSAVVSKVVAEQVAAECSGKVSKSLKAAKVVVGFITLAPLIPVVYIGSNWIQDKYKEVQLGKSISGSLPVRPSHRLVTSIFDPYIWQFSDARQQPRQAWAGEGLEA